MHSEISWFVDAFTRRVPEVLHAVVVSPAGLMTTTSAALPRDMADQLSALAVGLTGLTRGAARCFGAGGVRQTVVELEAGFLLVLPVDDSCLVVVASLDCDLQQVADEADSLVAYLQSQGAFAA